MSRILNVKRTKKSIKTDYGTPDWLFKKLDDEFRFDIDCAATKKNAKCDIYINKKMDALNYDWNVVGDPTTVCWLNPPYSKGEKACKPKCKKKICVDPMYKHYRGYHIKEDLPSTGDWMKKAYEESLKECVVVCLIPVSTATEWWFSWVLKAFEIRFMKKRLKFEGGVGSPSFDSCLVIYNKYEADLVYTPELPLVSWVDYE